MSAPSAGAAKPSRGPDPNNPSRDVVEGLVRSLFEEAMESNVESRAALIAKSITKGGVPSPTKVPTSFKKKKAKKTKKKKRGTEGGSTSVSAVELMAKQFPGIYQAVFKSLYGRPSTTSHTERSSSRIQSALDRRLKMELSRYRASHRLMMKSHIDDVRCRSVAAARKRQLAIRAQNFNKKLERIRSQRLDEDMQREKKSRQMKRESQQSLLVRNLFKEVLRLERGYLHEHRIAEIEAMRAALEEQENRYASAENFFRDKQDMLHDRILEELEEQRINDKSRRDEMNRVSKILTTNYKAKVKAMKNELSHIESHRVFLDEEHIKDAFENMNRKVTLAAIQELRRIADARESDRETNESEASNAVDPSVSPEVINETLEAAKVVASLTTDFDGVA